MLKRLVKKAKDGSGFQSNGKGYKGRDEETVSDGRQASLNNLLKNGYSQQEFGTSPPRQSVDSGGHRSLEIPHRPVGLPDYMSNPNAVLDDACTWRHGTPPDYTAANRNFMKGRSNIWPAGSLEDLVSNLIKNWKKETSHKARLEDWRTVNVANYAFSCNGGIEHDAQQMQDLGTSNALIQEAAFYSAKNTGLDESHDIFKRAMPGGFSWEVTEVYSGPPVMSFKWRHWGRMTGKLVCPIGPDTKLEAEATNQEVEIWGVSVVHLDSDFKVNRLEVFYDPHELMASLVDARNLSYRTPANTTMETTDMRNLTLMDSMGTSDGFMTTNTATDFDDNSSAFEALVADPSRGLPASIKRSSTPPPAKALSPHEVSYEDSKDASTSGIMTQGNLGDHHFRRNKSPRSPVSARVSLSNGIADLPEETDLPSDNALLSALMENPRKPLPGSRCPFPMNT